MNERAILDQIWSHLQVPYVWDSATIEGVAQILARHGWRQIPKEEAERLEENGADNLVDALNRWPRHTQRLIDRHTPARIAR